MTRETETLAPVELGAASEQTLGSIGVPTDLVRDQDKASGISDD